MRNVLAVKQVLAERLRLRGELGLLRLGQQDLLAGLGREGGRLADDPLPLRLLDEGGPLRVRQLLARLLERIVEDRLRRLRVDLVLREVEVGARGDALQLLTAKREVVLDVDGQKVEMGPEFFDVQKSLSLDGREVSTVQCGNALLAIEQ